MIYLELFITFLKIGTVSFGGGYGMISLIREEVLSHGWLGENELLDLIAVSESTPGPLAVNAATFIGSAQGGILGALAATAGVVLPAFAIILIIAAVLKNAMKYAGVKAVLGGVKPAVAALILSTAAITFLSTVFGVGNFYDETAFDVRAAAIFVALTAIYFIYKKFRKKAFSPVLSIIISGVLGVLLYFLPA